MSAQPWTWYMVALCALPLYLLSAAAVQGWTRWRRRRVVHRRARRAQRADDEAARVLRRAGYRIEARQVEHRWMVYLDGQAHTITLRADYLVRRRGSRYVAEVKSGRQAPSIRHAATRRQLIEYHMAFPVDGVLLVDMEQERIHVVRFGEAARQRRTGPWWPLLWSVLALIALAIAL